MLLAAAVVADDCTKLTFSGRVSCPLNYDAPTRFDELVTTTVLAQDEAVSTIRSQMANFLSIDQTLDGPILTHLSGPTGTGKTSLVSVLAQSLFAKRNEQSGSCGLYQVTLNMYTSLSSLLSDIEYQLQRCPRSLIFLDDLQHARSDEIHVLRPLLMTKSAQIHNTSTAQMWLIVASDFDASAQKTLPLPGTISSDEMADRVIKLTRSHFSSSSAVVLQMPIVPLIPFTLDDVVNIAINQLHHRVERAIHSVELRLSQRLPRAIKLSIQINVDRLQLRQQLAQLSQIHLIGMRALSSADGVFHGKFLRHLDDFLVGIVQTKLSTLPDWKRPLQQITWLVGERSDSCNRLARFTLGWWCCFFSSGTRNSLS